MKSKSVVPVIDIAPFRLGSDKDKQDVAKAFDDACRQIGFIVVTGHGVPQEQMQSVLEAGWKFFDLPDAEKRRWISSHGNFRRGYLPIGGNALSYTLDEESAPDLLEAFTMGKFDVPDDEYHRMASDTFFEPNIWPDQPQRFREALCGYYRELEGLADTLMRIFARALGLHEHYFADKIDRHITAMRINHYPAQAREPVPGQIRAGAHTDYGSLTILLPTDAPGGLQVWHRNGGWQDVQPVPGGFIINLGDLMARWTNDRWVSTLHRVVNPPRDQALGSRRISIAFFHQPNYDAVIECIETCQGADNPPRYTPITSGEHLAMKTEKEVAKTG